MTLLPGDEVRMTRKFRKAQRWSGWKPHGVPAGRRHVREFGRCVGIVLGLVQWPDGSPGPEVDVRWQPSGLKYMYDPKDLEVVR